MDNSQGDRIVGDLAHNILNAHFEDLDQDVVENTKTRILDTFGGAIGGANLPDIIAMINMVRGWGGKEEATIIGHGVKAPAQNVAFVNCTMCRGFDRGPLAYVFNGKIVPHHVSETTVMTAVTLGESKRVSGKELITSLVVGDDIAARMHLATDHPLPGEYHPGKEPIINQLPRTGVQTPAFGASAIAGRLLGLSHPQMKNTFGLVGNSDIFAGGIWDGAPTFKIGQGTAALVGIIAAQMAKGGWTGAIDPFLTNAAVFSRAAVTILKCLPMTWVRNSTSRLYLNLFPAAGRHNLPAQRLFRL